MTKTMTATMTRKEPKTLVCEPMLERAQRLGLYGLLAHWEEISQESWLERVVLYEEAERNKRSLERRIKNSKIGRFKLMADFNWQWPTKVDRELLDEIFRFGFLEEGANVVLVGPNGAGKTMIAKNLAHQAVLRGHTALFSSASELLNDLAARESGSALSRRLKRYLSPRLLVVDEIGYLSTSSRHADLLFEVVTRRYQDGAKPIVLTTNKPFREWNEVFPSSGCVVALVDRLLHKAEIIEIAVDESYRLKEARERAEARAKKRPQAKAKK